MNFMFDYSLVKKFPNPTKNGELKQVSVASRTVITHTIIYRKTSYRNKRTQ
jgi:hypothetical protein